MLCWKHFRLSACHLSLVPCPLSACPLSACHSSAQSLTARLLKELRFPLEGHLPFCYGMREGYRLGVQAEAALPVAVEAVADDWRA